MGEMAGKIVCTELVFRISSIAEEVLRPKIQMLLGEGGILLRQANGGHHHQHIAAFFHGHLIFRIGSVGVDLPVQ